MRLTSEWVGAFTDDSQKVFLDAVASATSGERARAMLEIARIYSRHDWFKLFVARRSRRVVGLVALFLDSIHGSHEGWVCCPRDHHQVLKAGELQELFEAEALANDIRILRIDGRLATVMAPGFFRFPDVTAAGFMPTGFLTSLGGSLEGSVLYWKIFDPGLKNRWNQHQKAWPKEAWNSPREDRSPTSPSYGHDFDWD